MILVFQEWGSWRVTTVVLWGVKVSILGVSGVLRWWVCCLTVWRGCGCFLWEGLVLDDGSMRRCGFLDPCGDVGGGRHALGLYFTSWAWAVVWWRREPSPLLPPPQIHADTCHQDTEEHERNSYPHCNPNLICRMNRQQLARLTATQWWA